MTDETIVASSGDPLAGIALICVEGLRQALDTDEVFFDVVVGIALICTEGLRRFPALMGEELPVLLSEVP